MTVIDEVAAQRIVPVLRCADAKDAIETARALAAGGLRAVELTMSTPGVLAAVGPLRDDGLLVGLGTIREAAEVAPAVEAGAQFVVSFANPPGFVVAADEAGVPAIPGAFTPTEIAAAQRERPAAVKLFPASLVGPGYARTLLALDPSLRLFVTGGIEPTAVEPWFEAGAVLVGIGSGFGTARSVGAAEVQRRARAATGLP